MKNVIIKSNKHLSIIRKHLWIFSGAIKEKSKQIEDGDIVKVIDENENFLALGHYQEHGSISVRILSFRNEEINIDFFHKQIKNAYELRINVGLNRKDNQIFRLIHGEGDNLPGLIIDYYNGVLVFQCHSYGMYKSINHIVEATKKVFKKQLKAIYLKSNDTIPGNYKIENKYLYKNSEFSFSAIENGIIYNINWELGQKTGFFIDQRENREKLKKLSNGKTVLNTFCYTGGFSLASLAGGASLVHSVDSSSSAIELCEKNIELNGFKEKHKAFKEDAINFVNNINEKYDIIILDPPAFAKNISKRHHAIQAYKRLNLKAINKIKSGGLLFTFSCSQVVDKQLFQHTILSAAIESGRKVKIVEQLHQPADHPINIFHPESEYLKGLILEIS